MLKEIISQNIKRIQDKVYDFSMKTLPPSEWAEQNLILSSESKFSGPFKYNRSPYAKEVVDNMRPNSGVEITAVMKCSQSGFTQSVAIPCLVYHIAESPTNMMFLSSSDKMVQNTIRGRFDTIMESSGLSGLLKTSSVKKANQRTGDTDFKKEYTGGTLINATYNASNLRFHSVECVVADEFDDAPRTDKKEGSIFDLIMARTKSYADTRRLAFMSSPTVKGISNIEVVYNMGDKRQWNWECPNCKEYIPILWRIDREDGTFGGIKWVLDDDGKLIEESVHYECQKCCGKVEYRSKYALNLTGKWIPTAVPEKPSYRSYLFNALCNPPGFESWTDLVRQWMKACPKNEPVDIDALKVFTNTQLGELWEDRSTKPQSTALMSNGLHYQRGVIPNLTCENDGNGRIALISLCCDLGGIMDVVNNIQDVRIDWEILAHSTNGQTYSINHGSIGTFKRSRWRDKKDRDKESDRTQWTFNQGLPNCAFDDLREIINTPLIDESGVYSDIDIALVDTGNFTKLAYNFVTSFKNKLVIGVKGKGEEDYAKNEKNGVLIEHSRENKGLSYMLYVNELKDKLAANMVLPLGTDGTQPSGYMNFPEPSNGFYGRTNYFLHFESEHRVPLIKNGQEIGYKWVKKNENNHFWDCRVYGLAAPEIFISNLKLQDFKNKDLTWFLFCDLINS
jgi:phage terminase large subunit GpA-like protein